MDQSELFKLKVAGLRSLIIITVLHI